MPKVFAVIPDTFLHVIFIEVMIQGAKGMTEEIRERQWETLRRIAETLNRSTEVRPMLQSVLEKLLEVTGLATGWIFLAGDRMEFEPVAVHRLPPGLSVEENRPMCQGSCWCLNKFWDGRLKEAANIMECKRLENAVKHGWGDTRGITHHATVPLIAGQERIGLLNVASPGKENFSRDELALLEAVAYQIGTAVQKTRLIQVQRQRVQQYARLDEVSRFLWMVRDVETLPRRAVCEAGRQFRWPWMGMWTGEGEQLKLTSLYSLGNCVEPKVSLPVDKLGPIGLAFVRQQAVTGEEGLEVLRIWWPECTAVAAVPISTQNRRIGVLSAGVARAKELEAGDLPILTALGEHLSLAMEKALLEEERKRLTRMEERNRLARDLHDSVNQKLFSLSLSAHAAKGFSAEQGKLLRETLEDIHRLSREALKEMRSLIWQLRPAGLEAGVMTALSQYGRELGLIVEDEVEGVRKLPRRVEEALWRIGQEALNNISRHAGTDRAHLFLKMGKREIRLEITDHGCGFSHESVRSGKRSLGLSSMEERVELLGGTFILETAPAQGTICRAVIPIGERSAGDADPDSVGG